MAYSDVALLADDFDFRQRIAAAYATETANQAGGGQPPPSWAQDHAWNVAGQPGFGDAYASAIASGVERPGNDPAVVTDEQLLSAVQGIIGQEAPA